MIYADKQLKEKISQLIESFESKVIEFEEARTNYSFNDIGKYFSALSNEANLPGYRNMAVFGAYPMTSDMWELNLKSSEIYKI